MGVGGALALRRGSLSHRAVVLADGGDALVGGLVALGVARSIRVLLVVWLVVVGWCFCFRGRVRSGLVWVGVVMRLSGVCG